MHSRSISLGLDTETDVFDDNGDSIAFGGVLGGCISINSSWSLSCCAFLDLLNIFPLICDLLMATRYAHIIRALDIEYVKKWKLKQLQKEQNANMALTVPVFDDDDAELEEKDEDINKCQLLPGQGVSSWNSITS